MTRAGFVAVVAVALVLRLAFLAAVNPSGWDEKAFDKHSFVDAKEYHNIAVNITRGWERGIVKPFMEYKFIYKTPAYPAFLAIVYSAAGMRFWLVMLLQALMDTAVCGMIYLLASRLTSNPHAPTLAGLLYAVDPLPIYYAATLMTETVFGLCTVAATYMIFMAEERGWRLRHVMAAGALLGAAAYFRYAGMYLPVVLAAAIPLSKSLRSQGGRRVLIVLVSFLLAYSATLAPWQYRNYVSYGRYSMGIYLGYNICFLNAGYANVWVNNVTWASAVQPCRAQQAKNPIERADKQFYVGLKYIADHPGEYLGVHLKGVTELFTNRPNVVPKRMWEVYGSEIGGYGIPRDLFLPAAWAFVALLIMAHAVFSVVGVVALTRERMPPFSGIIIIAAIAYFVNVTSIHGSSVNIDRYYFPVLPYTSAVAGVGISYALERVLKARAEDGREGNGAETRVDRQEGTPGPGGAPALNPPNH